MKVMDRVLQSLSVLGAVTIAVIFLLVVADVLARNLIGVSLRWVSALVEYAMLLAAMAVAPGLVRQHAHIRVEILSTLLPNGARRVLERLVNLTAFTLCVVLAWYATEATLAIWQRGEVDIRSIALPRWILFAMLSAGLALCAVEFLREAFAKTPGGAGHGAGEHGI